jgi:hypothetical protein
MKIDYESLWITVPTYWGDYGTAENPPCIDFDHPTALDGEETLSRTVGSLCELRGDFQLLVVLAVTHRDYLPAARSRVEKILAPFLCRKALYLITPDETERINGFLLQPLLQMNSYGNIRNVQLFLPYCLGAEIVVGIDDDEIIEDPEYLEKMVAGIGTSEDVGGLAGPYYDREGDFKIRGAEDLGSLENLFLKKNYFMNEALKSAMARSPDIHPSSVAFGGNMVFKRDTISRICHDPFIPRGEDYDYVINALMKGIRFYFHPEAGIVHLPPDSTGSQAGDNVRKLKADIRRFLYMSAKLKRHRELYPGEEFSYNLLSPYPGAFAVEKGILETQGEAALIEGYPHCMDGSTTKRFIAEAVEESDRRADEFFAYRELWADLVSSGSDKPELKAYLKGLKLN